jgi:Cys-tRNA(Pro) deacylase
MGKKKNITNAMRMLDKAKIKYEAVEYEAEEVGRNFGSMIAEITGIPHEKCFKTLVARGDKNGILVACIPADDEVDLKKLAKISGNKKSRDDSCKRAARTYGLCSRRSFADRYEEKISYLYK